LNTKDEHWRQYREGTIRFNEGIIFSGFRKFGDMIDERYFVEFGADFRVFEFDSEGPKGKIRKIIQYTEINLKNYFNLGFGDKNYKTNAIDDLVVTNNRDSQKILAAVASTLFEFTNHHLEANIIAIGNTLARTRLYRIGITNNLEAIEKDFKVYGLKNNTWHKFTKGIEYDAFLVNRRIVNLQHYEREKDNK
jgi:hypothetical protein